MWHELLEHFMHCGAAKLDFAHQHSFQTICLLTFQRWGQICLWEICLMSCSFAETLFCWHVKVISVEQSAFINFPRNRFWAQSIFRIIRSHFFFFNPFFIFCLFCYFFFLFLFFFSEVFFYERCRSKIIELQNGKNGRMN